MNFYILHSSLDSWVLRKYAFRLAQSLNALGYEAKVGDNIANSKGFSNLIVANYPLYRKKWRKDFDTVGVFLTHAETLIKKIEFRYLLNNSDYVLTMSESDAVYNFNELDLGRNIFKAPLPDFGDNKILPFQISIFSNVYTDGRKKEDMLINWLKKNQNANVLIKLIGYGWLEIAKNLEKMQISYQISCITSKTDFEYTLQQDFFSRSDVSLYMGNDGGALNIYDAFRFKVSPLVRKMGYSGELASKVGANNFENDADFYTLLDSAYEEHQLRGIELENSSFDNYAVELVKYIEKLQFRDSDKVPLTLGFKGLLKYFFEFFRRPVMTIKAFLRIWRY
jgi:hypothetical protein